jgi:hypothetical protein
MYKENYMASIVNIFADQGSDYTLTLTVKNDSGGVTDLTGYTAEAHFQKWTGASKVYKFTTTITSPTTGALRIILLGSVSDDIPSGRYNYDIVIHNSTYDITRRIIEGTLVLRPTASPKGATLLETGNKLLLEG